jgi:hypothetical protein
LRVKAIRISEILAYLENEIANSQKMVSFRYKIPCFRNDGVYQLHRSIEENIGVAASKADQNLRVETIWILLT